MFSMQWFVCDLTNSSIKLLQSYMYTQPLHAIEAYKRQTCAEDLREGLKLADSLFSKGKWRVVGGGRVGGP